jgi:hypothetical protein
MLFDIIILTETWLTSQDDLNLYYLDGYTIEHINRNYRKRGGGILMYIKRSITYNLSKKFCINDELFMESLCIDIRTHKNTTVKILGIYKPPSVQIPLFCGQLETIINLIGQTKTYIVGDFNIDLLNRKNENKVHDFINILMAHSFVPLIDKPTRITDFSSTLIDNIWTNTTNTKLTAGVIVNDISDHFPVFLSENLQTNNKPKTQSAVYKRQLNIHNTDALRMELTKLKWESVLNADDVNESFNNFYDTFLLKLDEYCPLKKQKSHLHKNKRTKWISNKLKNLCRKKNQLYKEFINQPNDTNRQRYVKYRNMAKHLLRKTESEYYTNKFANSNCINQTWQVIKSILNQSNAKEEITYITNNGCKLTDQKDICNTLNDHFIKIGETLSGKVPINLTHDYSFYLKNKNTSTIYLKPIDKTELLEISKSFGNKLSSDCIDLNMKTLKTLLPAIITPMEHIINLSLKHGVFPDKLKLAKVTPVFKKGDKTNMNNYRPISLLPQISKLFEKTFYNRIINFLDINNILSPSQYGFRKNSRTSYGIIDMVEKIHKALINNKIPIGLFIDLQKAFDTIDHKILLSKLYHYGIRGTALQWIHSYLSNRTQFTLHNNVKSTLGNITCGVPQGSILGPILFLIYINDIINASTKLSYVLFADDTNIFYADDNIDILKSNMEIELQKLVTWFKTNKLTLNLEKTNFIIFGPHCNSDINLRIDNQSITKVEYTKFLGVFIDQNLNWSFHIEHICNKIVKNLSTIYRTKHKLTKTALRHLYNSLIDPHINYCIEIWGNVPDNKLIKISTLQKRAIRLIENINPYSPSTNCFKNNKILKIKDIIEMRLCTLGYTASKTKLPLNLQKYFNFTFNTHNYDTRNNKNFERSKYVNKFSKISIIEKIKYRFNNVKTEIKNQPTLASFKNKLKNQMIEKY